MDLNAQIRATVVSQNLPAPSAAFLTNLTSSRASLPPLPSLIATSKSRILACDLTNSASILDASIQSFPDGVNQARTVEAKLAYPVHVQVLDIENLSQSRWDQIEELEAVERGETTRGREVIRVVADENEETEGPTQNSDSRRPAQTTAGSHATHRLILQDHRGIQIYALELQRIPRIGIGKTSIGEKILLRAGTVVARGTILLAPDTCVLLGGKVDAWHSDWVKNRLNRLKEAVGSDRPI